MKKITAVARRKRQEEEEDTGVRHIRPVGREIREQTKTNSKSTKLKPHQVVLFSAAADHSMYVLDWIKLPAPAGGSTRTWLYS